MKQFTASRHIARTLQPIPRKPLDPSNMRIMQKAGFDQYWESSKLHMMVRAAMASGKTRFVKYVMGAALHNDPTARCLAVVPACNIGDGYAEENVLAYPQAYNIPDLNWKINSKEHFTDNKQDVFNKFVGWLENKNLCDFERRAVISHVTFARLIEEGHGKLLDNIIINIDEVHHSAHDGTNGNNLGSALNYLLKNADKQGISLILTTATPSRTDSFKLIGDNHQDEFAEYEYNFAQYLEDTQYIKGYDYHILPSENNWLQITEDNNLIKRGDKVIVFMPGEGHKKVTRKVAKENVIDWINAVADKGTVISFDENGVCPIIIRGVSYNVLNLVEQHYQKKGIKYLNENPDAIDILLNVKVFAEGSDWTPANKIIIYGQRGSIVELIQSIGRVFRDHEKKVGKRSIVNIIHVLPHMDLAENGRESYNAMLKAINIALLFKSVNLPMDYVVLNRENPVRRQRGFNHIDALREHLGGVGDDELNLVIGEIQSTIITTGNEARRTDGEPLSTRDTNLLSMSRVADMLIENHDIGKVPAKEIAEMFILVSLNEIRLTTMRNLTNIDVSEIDYNLISEHDVSELYMCGMKPKEFWKWYENIFNSGEQFAIEQTQSIIKFHSVHDRYPNLSLKNGYDEDEQSLAGWLTRMRNAKIGRGKHVFYESCPKLAEDAGLPDMFDFKNMELIYIEKTKEAIKFHDVHGILPNSSSKIKVEANLGAWLARMRSAKCGDDRSTDTFYESCQKLAEDAGLPDMFEKIDWETIAIDKTNKIIKFYKKHGRYPIESSNNEYEADLRKWLGAKRSAKLGGKRGGTFYKSCQKLADGAGLPDMFELKPLDGIALERTQLLIDYYREYGVFPNGNNKTANFAKLGKWLVKMRGTKRKKTNDIFYESCQKLADGAGLPDMFELINKEKIALNYTQDIIVFYKLNNKYPSTSKTKPKEERKLASWLGSGVRAKHSKEKGRNTFYESCQKLAEDAGLPDMFEPKNRGYVQQ